MENITAKCPQCGGNTFESPAGNNPKPNDNLTCKRCGRSVRYRDLLAQMEKQSVKVASDVIGKAIDRLNKRR